MVLGKVPLLWIAKYWINNNPIKSHCYLPSSFANHDSGKKLRGDCALKKVPKNRDGSKWENAFIKCSFDKADSS